MKRATLKDIAKLVGVNVSTVSRALKDHPDISVNIKTEIKKIAADLNYHPNLFAASLRNQSTHLIALVIPEITMFFFPSVIKGIEEVVHTAGYQLMVFQSYNSLLREIENIKTCCDIGVDGLLISLSSESNNFNHLLELQELEIPVVLFDKSLDNVPFNQVLIDDVGVAEQATNYLVEKGCKKIVGLFGDPALSITQKRVQGFSKLLNEKKLLNKNLIAHASSVNEAIIIVSELITQHKPDGIFAMSDELIAGVLPALDAKKISQKECLVIGISDGHLPNILHPKISYMHHNGMELGKTAASRLLQLISHTGDQPLCIESKLLDVNLVL